MIYQAEKANSLLTAATDLPRTWRECSSLASFLSKISNAFHVLFDPLANHVEGLFLRLGGYLR